MKKVLVFGLCLTMILSMTACGEEKSSKKKKHKDKEKVEKEIEAIDEAIEEEITESEDSAIEVVEEVTEQTEETSEQTEPLLSYDYNYQEDYIKTIDDFLGNQDPEYFVFDLVFVDEDDIPELVIGEAGYYVNLYTYSNDEVHVVMDFFPYGAFGNHGYFYYPFENKITNSDSDYAGALMYESQYKIDEDCSLVFDGPERWFQMFPEDARDPWESIDPDTIYYFVDGVEVSEEEYNLYNPSGFGRMLSGQYTYDEIMEFLTTKTVPKISYYEVIMGDYTWEEASALCEQAGGHLATINTYDEIYYISDLIAASDNPNGIFYIGGSYVEENGGYFWTADSSYDAVGEYEWMEGEPTFTGATEDGRTVDESYMVILCCQFDWGTSYRYMDVPNNVIDAAPSYSGNLGYIFEIEK